MGVYCHELPKRIWSETGGRGNTEHVETCLQKLSGLSRSPRVGHQNLPSGRTIEESGDQAMEVYCAPAGSMDGTGNFRDAPAFLHIETALYLMTQPKWSACLTPARNAGLSSPSVWSPPAPPSRDASTSSAPTSDVGVAPTSSYGCIEKENTVPCTGVAEEGDGEQRVRTRRRKDTRREARKGREGEGDSQWV